MKLRAKKTHYAVKCSMFLSTQKNRQLKSAFLLTKDHGDMLHRFQDVITDFYYQRCDFNLDDKEHPSKPKKFAEVELEALIDAERTEEYIYPEKMDIRCS